MVTLKTALLRSFLCASSPANLRDGGWPRSKGTRPTSDKVREAIFNILGAAVVEARVLDLFAGTGALTLEALSRGAAAAVLVEEDPAALKVLQQNLETLALHGRVRCWRCRCGGLEETGRPGRPVQPGFSRPPVRAGLGAYDPKCPGGLGNLLGPEASVVAEHSHREPLPERLGSLRLSQALRRYGDTQVAFYGS